MMNEITKEKLQKYLKLTENALKEVKINKKVNFNVERAYNEFLESAKNYFEDAKFFMNKGDYVNAFACINYAHGWLDAGARIGIFDVKNEKLFSIDTTEK